MDRLNYFRPYESKGAGHEDQLTRAFLVVVRMVPLALSAFLDLVREYQISRHVARLLPSFSEVTVQPFSPSTQKAAIPQTTGRLISIIMTDEHSVLDQEVKPSTRDARYDGVLTFDPDWILVIENKPYSQNIWAEQVNPSLPDTHEIEVEPQAVVLLWRNVVDRLTNLLESRVLGSCEAILVGDYLEFLDEQFPYLNPYDNFGRCKESAMLLEKRSRAILVAIAPERVAYQRDWGTWYVKLRPEVPTKMCGLYPARNSDGTWRIGLAMYPGDTMRQARAFYRYLGEHGPERFFRLRERGWRVAPNFHFSFIMRGFGQKVRTALSLEEYFNYWVNRSIEQIQPDESGFETAFRQFGDVGMLGEEDIPELMRTGRAYGATVLNVNPGIEVIYSWPLQAAVQLDREREMVNEVRQRANEAISTWGGDPL